MSRSEGGINLKEKFAKVISILTVVPIMALFTASWIYLYDSTVFNNEVKWYIASLVFLTFIPISAYGLKRILPNYKNTKRDGERKLAFIMAVFGYITGLITALVFNASQGVLIIFITYFISGILLTFFNKFIKIKASGHACGVAGPIVLILYFIGIRAWFVVLLLPIVYWARVAQKRHSYKELIIGTLVGVLSGIVAIII